MSSLHDQTEFDCPFRVHPDGTVTSEHGVYAPEVFNVIHMSDFHSDQWELVNGFSGQDRYSGPIMHSSEYLGGGMEEWVMHNPGVYVITGAYYDAECENEGCGHDADRHKDEGCEQCDDCLTYTPSESEPYTIEGWALCFLKGSEPEEEPESFCPLCEEEKYEDDAFCNGDHCDKQTHTYENTPTSEVCESCIILAKANR
jgi:hypothetical protein